MLMQASNTQACLPGRCAVISIPQAYVCRPFIQPTAQHVAALEAGVEEAEEGLECGGALLRRAGRDRAGWETERDFKYTLINP